MACRSYTVRRCTPVLYLYRVAEVQSKGNEVLSRGMSAMQA
nr:MAG TPA: hypothetical protein [Caudoviricetes sp.]